MALLHDAVLVKLGSFSLAMARPSLLGGEAVQAAYLPLFRSAKRREGAVARTFALLRWRLGSPERAERGTLPQWRDSVDCLSGGGLGEPAGKRCPPGGCYGGMTTLPTTRRSASSRIDSAVSSSVRTAWISGWSCRRGPCRARTPRSRPRVVAERDHRQRRLQAGGAGEQHRIEAVQRRCANSHDRVATPRDLLRDLLDAEPLDRPVLAKDHGAHARRQGSPAARGSRPDAHRLEWSTKKEAASSRST
jgi:hypothetical protein